MKSGKKIKVLGVGGSGGNAVTRMAKCNIYGVELVAINCDFQDLKKTKAHKKVQIGGQITKGLGAGMDPAIGEKAAQESREKIREATEGADIVFVVCGLGGGTGTGAAPVVAEVAKQTGALTIGAVTMPFSFEGLQRKRVASFGRKKLKSKVDTLFVIPNDKLLTQISEEMSVDRAFWACDEILRQAVQGISDLLVRPGIINLDFADIKSVMSDSGSALFGVGTAKGENNIEEAANMAVNSPFLEFAIPQAKKILFNITGGKDLSLKDIERAAEIITKNTSATRVIFGAIEDKRLEPREVKIALIAAGIQKKSSEKAF